MKTGHYFKTDPWLCVKYICEMRETATRCVCVGGVLLPLYDIVRMYVPNSPLFQRCQVYDTPPFSKKKYMTGPAAHHRYMNGPVF